MAKSLAKLLFREKSGELIESDTSLEFSDSLALERIGVVILQIEGIVNSLRENI